MVTIRTRMFELEDAVVPSTQITEPRFVSLALRDVPVPDFAEAVIVPLPPGAATDPGVWARSIFSVDGAPGWVKALFGLREVAVRALGIPPAPRDVFDVREAVGEEVLIATDDRHLDFRVGVAVDVEAELVRVTTVVRLHGWRGRLYFAPVRVLHQPVLRAMLSRAVRRLASAGR